MDLFPKSNIKKRGKEKEQTLKKDHRPMSLFGVQAEVREVKKEEKDEVSKQTTVIFR